MPWWHEVIALVKEELAPGAPAQGPEALLQASDLLARTGRDIAQAQARAEAARRRLLRAHAQLETLTRNAQKDARYGERLVDLARVITHESELIKSFDLHIASLKQLGDNIAVQIRRLQHDADMVAAAQAARRTAQAAPQRKHREPAASEHGFRNQRPEQVIDRLKSVTSRKPKPGAPK